MSSYLLRSWCLYIFLSTLRKVLIKVKFEKLNFSNNLKVELTTKKA